MSFDGSLATPFGIILEDPTTPFVTSKAPPARVSENRTDEAWS
jgi:hypothetical protein